MNALFFTDVKIDSPDTWEAFTLAHGIDHDLLDRVLRKEGHQVAFYPLYEFPRLDNDAYLQTHWQVHQSHARVLGVTLKADLSTADFSDEDQVRDWLQQHAYIHLAENKALGVR